MLRAYELMVILDGGLEEAAVESNLTTVAKDVESEGGDIRSTDFWGKRRFAYEINHKTEGFYVVYEVVTESAGLPGLERTLRLADDVVRHKLFRLPDTEANRRGLLGEATPA